AQLPLTMDRWRADENAPSRLDPALARAAGASEYLVRDYVDEKSGERASALILYGLGKWVSNHTPELCYPAAGYELVKGPVDHAIEVPGLAEPVRYRWAIYSKRVGGVNHYEESYCTFQHRGEWRPDMSARWERNIFRYNPGLLKVQISRPVFGLNED